MIAEVTEAAIRLSADDSVRMLVIRGEGKSFCAGADLNWMKRMKGFSIEENRADARKLADLFAALDNFPALVIARIHGAALGGGTGLAAVADIVFAEKETKFGFTETRLGLAPAIISPYVIRKIGVSYARATFISGHSFSAVAAKEMGLVHHIVEGFDALERTIEIETEEYLKAAPKAARAAKKLALEVTQNLYSDDVTSLTVNTIADLRVADEGQEGAAALLEKRAPKWMEA
jgi:methylglutaconyl-CoA hydratase